MSDWTVMGLPGDPTAGGTRDVRSLAMRLVGCADEIRNATDQLRGIFPSPETSPPGAPAGTSGPQQKHVPHPSNGKGPAETDEIRGLPDADSSRSGTGVPPNAGTGAGTSPTSAVPATRLGKDLPELLEALAQAYRGCADALTRYADSLAKVEARSREALQQATRAFERYSDARQEADDLMPVGLLLPWRTGPAEESELCSALPIGQVEAMTAWLDEDLRFRVRAAVVRADNATADQETAWRLAEEAVTERNQAAARCEKEIDAALNGSGIKNSPWWNRPWSTGAEPFTSWNRFLNANSVICLVAGVITPFLSGPRGATLLAATVLSPDQRRPADTLHEFAPTGATLADVLSAVLPAVPGRHEVINDTRQAIAINDLAAAVRLGGSTMRGPGTGPAQPGNGLPRSGADEPGADEPGADEPGLRAMTPRGLTITGGLRASIRDPRVSARAPSDRFLRGDPVDVATGELQLDVIDVALPSSLPLVIRRVYRTHAPIGNALGPGWVTDLDRRLEIDDDGVVYAGNGGVVLLFPQPADGETVLPVEGPRYRLRATGDGSGFTVTDPRTGISEHFGRPCGLAGVTPLPLLAVTDRAGQQIDYAYDADGLLTGIAHSGGYRLRVSHTPHGQIHSLTLLDPAPDVPDTTLVEYQYDTTGRLAGVVNSSGVPARYDYDDATDRLIRWEDRNSVRYRFSYDSAGRVSGTQIANALPHTQFVYLATRTVCTDSLRHRWTYDIDESRQVTARTDPAGARTSWTWDRYQRLVTVTDPLARTTRHEYDEAGNLVATTLPDRAKIVTEYNENNQPVQVRLPDGAVWAAEYNAAGLLVSLSAPDGAITRYFYDRRGQLAAIVDPLGTTTTVTCDPAGLPVAVTDPLGATTTIVRDAAGHPVTVTDPLGATTQLEWTVEGLPISRTGPDGTAWNWTHDGEGNLRAATDPTGHTVRYAPTPFGQITMVQTPDGALTELVYDTKWQLAMMINPVGLTWHYTRDDTGRVVAETDFNGSVTTYDRDPAGQVICRTNGVGQTINYTHDLRGNVLTERTATPEATVTTYSYDPLGRLVRADNPDVDLRLTRDAVGRIIAESVNRHVLRTAHDPLGRPILRITPTGTVSAWDLDPAGRPRTLTTTMTGAPEFAFAWDRAGNPVKRRFGVTALAQSFDPAGRLLAQSLAGPDGSELILLREHGYTEDGQLAVVDDASSGVTLYTFDAAGRITRVTGPNGKESYDYDIAGNVTHATWPDVPHPEGPELGGREPEGPEPHVLETGSRGSRTYTGTRITRAGNVSYLHDAAGRLVQREKLAPSGLRLIWVYTWDAYDRLVQVRVPDGTVWRYLYDPLGRRVSKQHLPGIKTAGGPDTLEQTLFTWDGPILVETHQAPSGRILSFDHLPGTAVPVALRTRITREKTPHRSCRPGEAWLNQHCHALITDLTGTPTHLVHPDGQVVQQPATTVWGVPLVSDWLPADPDDAPPPTPAYLEGLVPERFVEELCPLRSPGHYHDPETGAQHTFRRYYDPASARYSSPDPLGLSAGPNPHACLGSLLHEADPFPRHTVDLAGGTNSFDPSRRIPLGIPSTSTPNTAATLNRPVDWDVPLLPAAIAGQLAWLPSCPTLPAPLPTPLPVILQSVIPARRATATCW